MLYKQVDLKKKKKKKKKNKVSVPLRAYTSMIVRDTSTITGTLKEDSGAFVPIILVQIVTGQLLRLHLSGGQSGDATQNAL